MSVFIIPHSGKYHGHFEFAVVMSEKQPSKLRVSVYEGQQKRLVYTKDLWQSGKKLALPPGEYHVRAELVVPRLDGSNLILDTVETHYSVLQNDRGASAASTPLSGKILREELTASSSHLHQMSPLLVGDATPAAAQVEFVSKGESATRFGSFPPSQRSASELNARASFACGSAEDEPTGAWRSLCATPNAALQCLRDPVPAQALWAFSEAPSKRATPRVARSALGAASTEEQAPSPFLGEQHVSSTPHKYVSPAENDVHTTSWLWTLSPTPVNGKRAAKASPGSAGATTADKKMSRTRNAEEAPLAAMPPSQQHSGGPAEPALKLTLTPFPYGTTTQYDPSGEVGVRPLNANMIWGRPRVAAQPVPLSHDLTPDNILKTEIPLPDREWTPPGVHAGPVSDREEKRMSNSSKKPSAKDRQQTAQSVMPTPLTELTGRGVNSLTVLTTKDNNENSPNRRSSQVQSPQLSTGKYSSTFVVPPPDVIDVHASFSLALAFGAPNAEPMTNDVFLNVLVEEEVEAGVKPQEPVVCVVPATLAAVPTRARGINCHWVCSPSIRASERGEVLQLLGDDARKTCTAVAISTVCVGPSCDGQTLSGLQFVLDNVERGILSCQFFVFFREVEDVNNEDEGVVLQYGSPNDNDDTGHSATVQDRNRQTPTLDERALSAEFIYNSLPYIRCLVHESGEMALEIHHKNAVVASEPVHAGSRVAMYFGTITPNAFASAGGGVAEKKQPNLSILVDYRTVFSYSIYSERGLDALRIIVMSRVESSVVGSGTGACMRLREVELLSQQRRLVAFADEVRLDDAKASRLRNSGERRQHEGGGPDQTRAGKLGLISTWVAGENPGVRAWRRVTLI
ncbi:hypothetical protein TraAM80_09703 [Trypanosoma rangeli]|uniref:Uncharacterized protein n=1 Tax=Trypanosoma rangeli TaxID=5698 RepID=A0A3R7R634_TRYRA|nr:uncharacterized protein TraAM80_09703 [Trypanosoma rangeli]RNE96622.1 hypothetical protein TraAM80_09703 [Trypanosoma rangeli]|eukprot:RNE96622.1 hypothetical protein TraAM80_09703 [Trypanosoma rangeli]